MLKNSIVKRNILFRAICNIPLTLQRLPTRLLVTNRLFLSISGAVRAVAMVRGARAGGRQPAQGAGRRRRSLPAGLHGRRERVLRAPAAAGARARGGRQRRQARRRRVPRAALRAAQEVRHDAGGAVGVRRVPSHFRTASFYSGSCVSLLFF